MNDMPTYDLRKPVEDLIKQWEFEWTRDLASLVAIPSIQGPAEPDAPYGRECREVVDAAVEMSQKYGFDACQEEGCYGYCDFGNLVGPKVGIFSHLDVVPIGDSAAWSVPPFRCTEKDEYLFGRGTRDNKGSFIAALYTLRILKELRIPMKIGVRLFFGSNEETGMRDIERYLEKHPAPRMSLVPDGQFPLSFAESGNLSFHVCCKMTGNLLYAAAGFAKGVIPPSAEATFCGELCKKQRDMLRASGIVIEGEGNVFCLKAFGQSKHVAYPEGSVNAIKVLLEGVRKANIAEGNCAERLLFLADTLDDYYGHAIGLQLEDAVFGKTLHTISVLRCEDGQIDALYNLRYPANADVQIVKSTISKHFTAGGFSVRDMDLSPAYISECSRSDMEKLAAIADEVTGCGRKLLVMTGGTYARKLPNAVAYGIGIPGQYYPFGNQRGDGHQMDECIAKQMIRNAILVYTKALLDLNEVLK